MLETKKLLQISFVFTLIFVVLFLFILLRVDPFTAGKSALIYFLSILFLALTGILTLTGYYIRMVANKNKTPVSNFMVSLRHAFLISTALVGLLILKSMESLA